MIEKFCQPSVNLASQGHRTGSLYSHLTRLKQSWQHTVPVDEAFIMVPALPLTLTCMHCTSRNLQIHDKGIQCRATVQLSDLLSLAHTHGSWISAWSHHVDTYLCPQGTTGVLRGPSELFLQVWLVYQSYHAVVDVSWESLFPWLHLASWIASCLIMELSWRQPFSQRAGQVIFENRDWREMIKNTTAGIMFIRHSHMPATSPY